MHICEVCNINPATEGYFECDDCLLSMATQYETEADIEHDTVVHSDTTSSTVIPHHTERE